VDLDIMMSTAPDLIVERLKIRRQFLHVAQGQKATGRFALLQVRPTSDPAAQKRGLVRYGLTASKKVGNAVARNRARRRLRAAMLELLAIHGVAGHDYVAVARTATVTAEWPALLDDLARQFIRLSQPRLTQPPSLAAASATAPDAL
jgi:ribonuclease P protein component